MRERNFILPGRNGIADCSCPVARGGDAVSSVKFVLSVFAPFGSTIPITEKQEPRTGVYSALLNPAVE